MGLLWLAMPLTWPTTGGKVFTAMAAHFLSQECIRMQDFALQIWWEARPLPHPRWCSSAQSWCHPFFSAGYPHGSTPVHDFHWYLPDGATDHASRVSRLRLEGMLVMFRFSRCSSTIALFVLKKSGWLFS